MTPELSTAFGVTVSALFLYPHCGRQDQVGGQRTDCRIRIGDDDEVARIAPARHTLFIDVRPGLHVVGTHGPVNIQLAVFQRTVLCYRMQTDFRRNGAARDIPLLLADITVFLVGHHHVRRQTVSKGAHFTRSTTRRRLPGQGERTATRLGNFAGQQVQVVDQVVSPHATSMLVEAHRPVGDDFLVRIGIQLRQLF